MMPAEQVCWGAEAMEIESHVQDPQCGDVAAQNDFNGTADMETDSSHTIEGGRVIIKHSARLLHPQMASPAMPPPMLGLAPRRPLSRLSSRQPLPRSSSSQSALQ